MCKRIRLISTGLFGLTILMLCALPAAMQAQEVKPKPPMYTYVANWQVARANWAEMEKAGAPVHDVLKKAMADGTIAGFGSDINLVHEPDAETHDVWWSSMSMAGMVKALEAARGASDAGSTAMNTAKHWDEVYVARYYNWKPGAFKDAYTQAAIYQLKEDAPDGVLDDLSQHFIVPLLEKMLADGTILEYEIDTQAVHKNAPGMFVIVYITPKPEGLDTVEAAIRDTVKKHPLGTQAFGSVVVNSAHRDELMKSEGQYK
ncbi:MAG: hypothetical protein WCA37_14945 [Terracidiphilus sp.]